MAGFDKRTGPSLYYLDYIATLQKLEKGALGFGEQNNELCAAVSTVCFLSVPSADPFPSQ
jgi:hypothetical protein